MSMLNDETTILKGIMMQLNEEAAVLVTLQYHTEKNEFSKVDRSKSKYRWFARIFKIEDLKKKTLVDFCTIEDVVATIEPIA